MREGPDRYSAVSIALHWLTAGLFVANVIVGGRFEEAKGAEHLWYLGLHKSFGISILALTLVRLGWRLAHPWPPLPPRMRPWERQLARGSHIAFYVLLIVIPLLGWATVSASGAPATPLWNAIPWPNLPLPLDRPLAGALRTVHTLLVKAAYGVIALHVLGALKHQFINKDNELNRMLPIFPRR
jgi:cytochrome b561